MQVEFDTEKLSTDTIIQAVTQAGYGASVKTDPAHQAQTQTTAPIKRENPVEAQMNESIKLFSDVKAIFTNLDGTYNVEGFVNYLNTHPDYFLVLYSSYRSCMYRWAIW